MRNPAKVGSSLSVNFIYGITSASANAFGLFFVFVLIARNMDLHMVGLVSFAIAFSSIFQLITEFGLSHIVIREIAYERVAIQKLTSNIVGLCLLISLIASLALIAVVEYATWEGLQKTLCYWFGYTGIVQFNSTIASAIVRGKENFKTACIGECSQKFMLIAAIGYLVLSDQNPIVIAQAFLVATIWQYLYLILYVHRHYAKVYPAFEIAVQKVLFIDAVKSGAGLVLRQLGWRIDIIVISVILGMNSVAIYSMSYRVIAAVTIISMMIALVSFPRLVKILEQSQEQFAKVYITTLRLLTFLSLPITVILFTEADLIISFLFGNDLQECVILLKLLSFTVITTFLSNMMSTILICLNKNSRVTYGAALTVIGRIPLNILLLDKLGLEFAVITIFLTDGLIVAYWMKSTKIPVTLKDFPTKILISGLIMAVVNYTLMLSTEPTLLSGIFSAAVGAAVYLIANFVLKSFSDEEVLNTVCKFPHLNQIARKYYLSSPDV